MAGVAKTSARGRARRAEATSGQNRTLGTRLGGRPSTLSRLVSIVLRRRVMPHSGHSQYLWGSALFWMERSIPKGARRRQRAVKRTPQLADRSTASTCLIGSQNMPNARASAWDAYHCERLRATRKPKASSRRRKLFPRLAERRTSASLYQAPPRTTW